MIRVISIGLILALGLAGAPPVGTVSSAESFRISGAAVPVTGVPNWPLAAGDQLVMGNAPGRVRFQDGTQLLVLPKTKLEIGAEGSRMRVTVREGGVEYRFANNSNVELSALTHRVSAGESQEGRLWLANGDSYWHAANAAFLLVVEPVEREVGEPIDFVSRRITPGNFNEVPGWDGFNPDWSNKPGDDGPPNQGLPPPGQEIGPDEPAWISGREP